MRLWNDRHLRLSLTGLGIQYLIALLAVGAFVVNTGNNLLYLVFSLMLGLFLVSGILSRRALQGLRVTGIEEGNLFARVRGGIRLHLQDAGKGRIRGLELHLALEEGSVEPSFLSAASRSVDTLVVFQARAAHRGWTRIRALEFRTRFPFGLLEKSRFLDLEREVLVLPHPRTPPAAPASWRGEGHRTLAQEGTSSPEGARPLRLGDAPGRVHWKRTAQRSQPWVRTFEEERPLGLHLRLDLTLWGPGRPFERELERLSGAILQARLQKRDISLELQGPEGIREVRGHTPCWRALALAEAVGTGEGAPGEAPLS
ncbi:DUF58 domain-containing protein [Geothrix sp. PMB-07]|uniref:DUF58 domain-containing protein n=1 Tax=Geothrix sp. PMB-07 TaxID=3068640 RepID=UPI002740BB9F|nr:DUF58 domain-containing protein [Geothrix sp. PMB-07]WLT31977.1 DUF58 domain-containing protein [Geothrix sp. PMB-07]